MAAAFASSNRPALTTQPPRRAAIATPNRDGALPRPTRTRAAGPSGNSSVTRGLPSPRAPHRSETPIRRPPHPMEASSPSSGITPSAPIWRERASRAPVTPRSPSKGPRRQRPAVPTLKHHPPREGSSGSSRSSRSTRRRSPTFRGFRSERSRRRVRSRRGPEPTIVAVSSPAMGPRAATNVAASAARSGAS